MKIKILKCSNSIYWYQQYIGETFDVVNTTAEYYWCRERDEYKAINFIRKEDTEVIYETT